MTSTANQNPSPKGYFNFPLLDALLPSPGPPILELISPPNTHHPSSAGKTSLLYLIIAHAIFPCSHSSTGIDGNDAAVILFDPLNHFSAARLASVMLSLLHSKLQSNGKTLNDGVRADMKAVVKRALVHVHIFRPSSWSTLLTTLRSLPDYLFDGRRHKSTHRRVHSIILEDIDAFVWSIRNSLPITSNQNALATASSILTTAVVKLSNLFSCATILSSHSSSNNPTTFRPYLPTQSQVTRLAVRRVEVLKFAPAISIEEAETERQQRWEVVSRGQFECWKVGVGGKEGEGFVFKVGGVEIEKGGG
jgi:hypothetical protein